MLEFKTLGTINLRKAGVEEAAPRRFRSVLGQPKRLAVLAYLAIARPPGPIRRDSLLAIFWPESSQKKARNALNQAVFALRRSLGSDVIATRGESLEVDAGILWCDAAAFRTAVSAADLEAALKLYRGPLLPGLHVSDCPRFERWVDREGRLMERRALECATQLAETALAAENRVAAVRWLARAGELAPYDEKVLRRRIRLLAELGDRPGALRAYERFRENLRGELDLDPSAATVELVRRIETEPAHATAAEETDAIPEEPVSSNRTIAGEAETARIERQEPDADWRRAWSLVAGTLLTTVIVVLLFAVTGDGTSARDDPATDGTTRLDPRRVLVASLTNRTGLDSLDVIGDLTADWISHELARTGLARVVPSTLLEPPADDPGRGTDDPSEGSLRAVARRAGAGILVHGSYARMDGRLVFETGVIDVESGTLVRSLEPVTTPLEELVPGVISVRERLAGALATVLDPRFGDWGVAASQPPDIEAYRLYARGLDQYAALDFRAAHESFTAAAELDSTFTAPLIWAMQLPIHGNSEVDAMARQLEEKKPQLAPWDRAMLDYRMALARGSLLDAYRAIMQVVELVPRSHWWLEAAELALMLNAPTDALAHLERAAAHREDPIAPNRYWHLKTRALHSLQRFGDELATVEQWRDVFANGGLGAELRAKAALGRSAEVEKRIRELLADRDWNRGLVAFAGDLAAELRTHGAPDAGRRVRERVVAAYQAAPDSIWNDRPIYVEYARALAFAGRLEEARDIFTRLLGEEVLPEVVRGDLGVIAGRLDDEDEAEALADWFAAESEREAPYGGGWYKQWQARIVASLDRKREAVELLRAAHEKGWAHLLSDHREPDFDPLRGYPPFEELMRPRRLPVAW